MIDVIATCLVVVGLALIALGAAAAGVFLLVVANAYVAFGRYLLPKGFHFKEGEQAAANGGE